jgi:hypothetical protein
MADPPALRPDGQLRDASEIVWYNDSDDAHPIQPTSRSIQEGPGASLLLRITVHLGSTDNASCQVNAHVQSGRPQVHGSLKPLLQRSSMNSGTLSGHIAGASHSPTNIVLVGPLLNASEPPETYKMRLMRRIKPTRPLLRMDQTMMMTTLALVKLWK